MGMSVPWKSWVGPGFPTGCGKEALPILCESSRTGQPRLTPVLHNLHPSLFWSKVDLGYKETQDLDASKFCVTEVANGCDSQLETLSTFYCVFIPSLKFLVLETVPGIRIRRHMDSTLLL